MHLVDLHDLWYHGLLSVLSWAFICAVTVTKSKGKARMGIWHICGDEIYTGCSREHTKETDYLKDLDLAKMVILKWLLNK
jgi:hypothetical protein